MNKQEIQETINELHRMKKRLTGAQGCSVNHQEANAYSAKCLRLAISALEKQIPKKIDRVGNKCPVCKCYLASEPIEDDYCFNCGQAIDWRNKNEKVIYISTHEW